MYTGIVTHRGRIESVESTGSDGVLRFGPEDSAIVVKRTLRRRQDENFGVSGETCLAEFRVYVSQGFLDGL